MLEALEACFADRSPLIDWVVLRERLSGTISRSSLDRQKQVLEEVFLSAAKLLAMTTWIDSHVGVWSLDL